MKNLTAKFSTRPLIRRQLRRSVVRAKGSCLDNQGFSDAVSWSTGQHLLVIPLSKLAPEEDELGVSFHREVLFHN